MIRKESFKVHDNTTMGDGGGELGTFQRHAPAARPATMPLAQAHWKLKPPIRPSIPNDSG
jgi:hypothetical protein